MRAKSFSNLLISQLIKYPSVITNSKLLVYRNSGLRQQNEEVKSMGLFARENHCNHKQCALQHQRKKDLEINHDQRYKRNYKNYPTEQESDWIHHQSTKWLWLQVLNRNVNDAIEFYRTYRRQEIIDVIKKIFYYVFGRNLPIYHV